jgi:hypothetical protein
MLRRQEITLFVYLANYALREGLVALAMTAEEPDRARV